METETSADLTLFEKPLPYANHSGLPSEEVAAAIAKDNGFRQIVKQLSDWRNANINQGTMFDRKVYMPPDSPFERMRVAKVAVSEDDVVGGLADATEAIAFHGGLKWESENPDESDILNQWAADVNLDDKVRQMWRETFTYSHFFFKLFHKINYCLS